MGGALYASGSFTAAGGVSGFNSVARWDGANWSPLGSGMNDGVWRLAFVGQDLYAGGIFTTAGGGSANYVAKYCGGAPEVPTAITMPSSAPEALAYHLQGNVPNPFNPATTIRYELREAGPVSLRVYDIAGQLVRELVSGMQPAGTYQALWDGRNSGGRMVSSGVYLYELRAGDYMSVKKMLLMKQALAGGSRRQAPLPPVPSGWSSNADNTRLQGWKYGFESPFKAEVYFVSTRRLKRTPTRASPSVAASIRRDDLQTHPFTRLVECLPLQRQSLRLHDQRAYGRSCRASGPGA